MVYYYVTFCHTSVMKHFISSWISVLLAERCKHAKDCILSLPVVQKMALSNKFLFYFRMPS